MNTTLSTPSQAATPLFSRGLSAVLLAQFLSAFADNAILVGAIKLVLLLSAEKGMDALLQGSFVMPYILLAPFVGLLADALPKGRVMWLANAIKLLSGALMLTIALQGDQATTLWVIIAYVLTGIGAAVYSPAKYGILTQLCGTDKLVQANGLMEGSTIVAILLGFVCGGWLADSSLVLLLGVITTCYALAVGLSLLIPRLPCAYPDARKERELEKYPSLHAFIREVAVPEMQIKLRQGFGRAIRTESDTCVIAILDERACRGRRYAQAVSEALPEMRRTGSLREVTRFLREKKPESYFEVER